MENNTRILALLHKLKPITLEEMSGIRLMNRTDTKFVTNKAKLEQLLEMADELETLMLMAEEEGDDSLDDKIVALSAELAHEAEEFRLSALLSGEYDKNNAIVSLHAGAGGTEAQDWAQMLYRMITRWAERHNFKYHVLYLAVLPPYFASL